MISRYLNIILLLTLTFSIVLSTVVPSFIFATYQLNKKEITEKFCVNKDKPKLKCHGRCHMKDQLEQADQTNHEQQKSLPSIKEMNFHYWNITLSTELEVFATERALTRIEFSEAIPEGYPFIGKHPPKQLNTKIARVIV